MTKKKKKKEEEEEEKEGGAGRWLSPQSAYHAGMTTSTWGEVLGIVAYAWDPSDGAAGIRGSLGLPSHQAQPTR